MTMKKAHLLSAIALFASLASSLAAQTIPQNQALGLVAKSTGGFIGNAAATEGSSVYSGDYLSTQDNGSLLVRLGALSLELQGSSGAHVYGAPYGAIVELDRGTLVYITPGTQQNLVVVASDVRVTPALDTPDFGRVSIDDPCDLTVYSQRGQAHVQVGSESRMVEQGKAYHVRAENELTYSKYLSPDAGDYHRYHEHRACAPPLTAKNHIPMAAGQSHFLIATVAVVGGITTFGVLKALESPDRP